MMALRRSLVLPSLFALALFVVLVSLGVWQIERKAWKEGLIATLDARLAAPPVALPPPQSWPSLDPAADEFRRVKLRVEFPAMSEARLYASGSAIRDDIKQPGYFVFAPARLPDGSEVVINRGYVEDPRPGPETKPSPRPDGPVEIVGVIRFPDKPGWFDTDYSARDQLWFVRDTPDMAARRQWGPVAPFYIDQETPVPPGGVPKPGQLTVHLRNEHLQYAITWFGLALVLVVMFGIWVRKRNREEA